jgi:hypothetical protein
MSLAIRGSLGSLEQTQSPTATMFFPQYRDMMFSPFARLQSEIGRFEGARGSSPNRQGAGVADAVVRGDAERGPDDAGVDVGVALRSIAP